MARYTSLQQVCQDALFIQSAGNPHGIAHALVDMISFLKTLPECSGTDWIKSQCAVVLVTFQLASLTGVVDIGSDRWTEAERLCREGAGIDGLV